MKIVTVICDICLKQADVTNEISVMNITKDVCNHCLTRIMDIIDCKHENLTLAEGCPNCKVSYRDIMRINNRMVLNYE